MSSSTDQLLGRVVGLLVDQNARLARIVELLELEAGHLNLLSEEEAGGDCPHPEDRLLDMTVMGQKTKSYLCRQCNGRIEFALSEEEEGG